MRYRILAVAGWSLLGLALLAGAAGSGELRCRKLVVEDDRGRERISMQVLAGGPTVTLVDAAGAGRVMLTVTGDGQAAVVLSGGDGARGRINLGVDRAGLSWMILKDKDGRASEPVTEPLR